MPRALEVSHGPMPHKLVRLFLKPKNLTHRRLNPFQSPTNPLGLMKTERDLTGGCCHVERASTYHNAILVMLELEAHITFCNITRFWIQVSNRAGDTRSCLDRHSYRNFLRETRSCENKQRQCHLIASGIQFIQHNCKAPQIWILCNNWQDWR